MMNLRQLCRVSLFSILFFYTASGTAFGFVKSYVTFEKKQAAFTLASSGRCAPLYADSTLR